MIDLNRVELIGRLISEPTEVKSNSNIIICKFKLATNDKYYNKLNIENSITEKHFIKCINQNAKYAISNLSIGSLVYILGKNHTYTFEQDEKSFKHTEIRCRKLIDLSKNKYSDITKLFKNLQKEDLEKIKELAIKLNNNRP